jgi:hypothetical protein
MPRVAAARTSRLWLAGLLPAAAIAGRSLLGAGLRGGDIFEGKQRFGREQDRKEG